MSETCPLLLLKQKSSWNSRTLAQLYLMVSSLGYARWASLSTFDPAVTWEAKIAIYLYRKLEFAMLLLSLKTLLMFKMRSRFVFLFSFHFFFEHFQILLKTFSRSWGKYLIVWWWSFYLYHLPTQSYDMIFFYSVKYILIGSFCDFSGIMCFSLGYFMNVNKNICL